MRNSLSLPFAAIALLTLSATAIPASASITYSVTVSTSAISGASGFIDFSFASGFDSQSAYVTITGFSTDGVLTAAPDLNGGVSGLLPGGVTIDNSTFFNDYFQAFDFGSTIEFLLRFDGPAVDSPNGTSASGSTFSFGMFASDGTTPVLTVDPSGSAFLIDLDLSGNTAVTPFSATGSDPSAADIEFIAPEPGSCVLLALGLAAVLIQRRRQEGPPQTQ